MKIRARAFPASLAAAILLAALCPATISAEAEAVADANSPDDSAVLLFHSVISQDRGGAGPAVGEEAYAFGTALEEALGRALSAQGFRVAESSEALAGPAGLPAESSARALAAGARWAAYASLAVTDKRLAYTMRIFDATEAALAAASSFSAYAGLSTLPLIEDSAKSTAIKAAAYRANLAAGGGRTVQYRISLSSPDEGARVFLGPAGEEGSREVGTIAEGALELPYIPFAIGSRIVIGLSSAGKRSLELPVELGEEAPTLAAPALRNIAKENLLIGTGAGRLLGIGATYRYFIRPEWSFIFFNDKLFAGYDFQKGSSPVLHLEAWEGIGCYLLFPPSSRFRFGACIGGGLLFSQLTNASTPTSGNSLFVDLAIIPYETFFEYRFTRGPTYWVSVRGAYSLTSSGLLGPGWMRNGQPDLSLGLMWGR